MLVQFRKKSLIVRNHTNPKNTFKQNSLSFKVKASGTLKVDIKEIFILSSECIYGFRTILRVNRDYFRREY